MHRRGVASSDARPLRYARRLVVSGLAATAAVALWTAAPAEGAPGPAPQRMTVYAPEGHHRVPAVLYIHGGAWRRGVALPAERQFARTLARRTGWVVAVPAYRTDQPRRTMEPADVHAALVALARRPDVDPRRMVLWGESAGADLALLEAYLHPNGDQVRICAVVSVSGPTDLLSEFASGGQLLLKAVQDFEEAAPPVVLSRGDRRYQQTSAVFQVTPDSPATFQALATADPYVPPSQVKELDEALTRDGVAHTSVLVAGNQHATLLEVQRVGARGPTVADMAVAFVRAHLND